MQGDEIRKHKIFLCNSREKSEREKGYLEMCFANRVTLASIHADGFKKIMASDFLLY